MEEHSLLALTRIFNFSNLLKTFGDRTFMSSSWDSYSIIFLSAVFSLGIPLFLSGLSFLFRGFSGGKGASAALGRGSSPQVAFPIRLNQTLLGQRMNVRFFLAANAALILITLGLELIPCVTTLQTNAPEDLLKGLLAIISLAGFAVLGLLYAVRKGDMGWLSSYRQGSNRDVRFQSGLKKEG
jgi:hypothetical protein